MERLLELVNGLVLFQLVAMCVGIIESIFVEDAKVDDAVEEILRAIVDQRHIDVGHDAATAIYGLSFWCGIFQ